jgi:hypothetical protein
MPGRIALIPLRIGSVPVAQSAAESVHRVPGPGEVLQKDGTRDGPTRRRKCRIGPHFVVSQYCERANGCIMVPFSGSKRETPISETMPKLATPTLNAGWSSMTIERYATLERATGVKAVKVGDIWWQQVRPFFYRPLLPFKRFDLKLMIDGFTKFGAFQYAVEDGQSCNSYLNPIIFDEPHNDDIKKLPYNAQKHVKKALKNNLTVSRIVDEKEFSEIAYPCYLSFYERTKYGFDANRRHKDGFSRWSHAVFQFPETVILGAFADRELISFEIGCLVEDTFILKTLVNSDKALKLGASDLLLHSYRISVREQPNIHLIYDSMLGQRSGINEFYLVRGARVLALPAFLHMHPALLWLIRKAKKGIYARLFGLGNEELLCCPSRPAGHRQHAA